MVKKANIIIRANSSIKQRIQAAARASGKSMTDFVLEAAIEAAGEVEDRSAQPQEPPSGACPTFFKALCLTASAGGASSYGTAGYELTRALGTLAPFDVDDDDWFERLQQLADLLESDGTDEEIVEWFEGHLPGCMNLVPKRRQQSFVAGVHGYAEDHGARW